jgi:uncharacterized protein DUF3604
MDAGAFGARLSPKDAYRFAKGEEVIASSGQRAKLSRPLIESFTGRRIDREYAENRVRWKPLYEATQIKGDGETHPFLSPNDEFANFERWDKGNLDLTVVKTPISSGSDWKPGRCRNGFSALWPRRACR